MEVGEVGIADFIKDFYANLAQEEEDGGRAGIKDARVLDKEILKGTTGGGKGKKLQNAREEGEAAEED